MVRPPLDPAAPICGSRFNDILRSRGGSIIVAFSGNDLIYARNRRIDEVWGGPGRDRAVVDRRDFVRGVERVIRP
jgi:hypothetical protein